MDRIAGARSGETTSARANALALAREWALPLAIGAAALLLDQLIRLPVQLPGHNGVLWIGGLVSGRLASRNGLGASAAGVGGMLAAASSDPLAGFEIAVAGLVVDALVAMRPLPAWLWLPLVGAVASGTILALKLATGSAPHALVTRGLLFAVTTYVVYGAIGAALPSFAAFARRARADESRIADVERV